MGIQSRKQILLCCLCVLFSFPFEVMDLDADDAKDSVPLSPGSTADFLAETEIVNPLPKKKVAVKKIAPKSELQSFRWVNIGIK